MPHIRLNNGLRVADPGGDPATPLMYGTNPGGFAESNGKAVSTQVAGWRQALIDRGGAVSTS